jgi:hypothetical protein
MYAHARFEAISARPESRDDRTLKSLASYQRAHFHCLLIGSEVHKAADPGMANFRIGTPDHFQPDCAGRKWSISLFDRMIHAPGTFRSARSCSSFSCFRRCVTMFRTAPARRTACCFSHQAGNAPDRTRRTDTETLPGPATPAPAGQADPTIHLPVRARRPRSGCPRSRHPRPGTRSLVRLTRPG